MPLRLAGVNTGLNVTCVPGCGISPTAVSVWAKPWGGIMQLKIKLKSTRNAVVFLMTVSLSRLPY
jgi:hypothetical protein